LEHWLGPLLAANVIVAYDAAEQVPAKTLAGCCRAAFPNWKARLFAHPLWQGLVEGTLPREIFLGWLIESYHFIDGVSLRLPMMISRSADWRIRRHFVRHFSEEYDHRHFFLTSLAAAGFDLPDVINRPPLPGTAAVLNCMREAARRDPLAYAACSAFLESTGVDRDNARRFFDRLRQGYDLPGSQVVRPLLEHVGLDEDYGHGSFIEKICGEFGEISRARVDAALSAASMLTETLQFWSQDILEFYKTPSAKYRGPRPYRDAMQRDQIGDAHGDTPAC
jgi:hypothetical protein